MGPNGAGRTTALSMAVGLLRGIPDDVLAQRTQELLDVMSTSDSSVVPARTGSMTRRTRGSVSLSTSESRCVARARIHRSFASSTWSPVIGVDTGTAISSALKFLQAAQRHDIHQVIAVLPGCRLGLSSARVCGEMAT
nr:hypothetical protein [Candidatus Frankia nodulisporulans]